VRKSLNKYELPRDSKSGVGVSLPRVRIPPSPPVVAQQSSVSKMLCEQNDNPAERHVPRGFSFIPVDLAISQILFLRSWGRFFSELWLRMEP